MFLGRRRREGVFFLGERERGVLGGDDIFGRSKRVTKEGPKSAKFQYGVNTDIFEITPQLGNKIWKPTERLIVHMNSRN